MRRKIARHAACVFVLFAFACASNSPASAVKRFYKAIGDGKTDDALDLLSDRTVSTAGKEKLRAGIQNATRAALDKGGMKDVQITNEQVASEIANVTAVVRYGDGTAQTEKVKLVKEGLGWKLQLEK
jgi:ketosteroid isomerase-like protein